MQPKLIAQVVKRDGKYFVSVSTPMGTPDVQHPTTFDPDFQDEIGPFDSEEEANKQFRQVEDTLRQRGQLWEVRSSGKKKKGAKGNRK
jgi:hypothetical protein